MQPLNEVETEQITKSEIEDIVQALNDIGYDLETKEADIQRKSIEVDELEREIDLLLEQLKEMLI